MNRQPANACPDNRPELIELFAVVSDETATKEQVRQLETILASDDAATAQFVRFMFLHALLERYEIVRSKPATAAPCFHPMEPTGAAGSFSGETLFPASVPGAIAHLTSGWPVAYLIATAIFAIGLTIGSIVHVAAPQQAIRQFTSIESPVSPVSTVVARITSMVDCQWEGSGFRSQGSGDGTKDSPLSPFPSPLLHLGDRLALKSGLLEIVYDTGAKVLLQGPITYEVESPAGGYLSLGKLTARLEEKSEAANQKSEIRNQKSFAIRTPTAVVTDLGTEFGVEVSASGITATHVFRGVVEVQPVAHDGQSSQAVRLTENESVRVEKQLDGKNRIVHQGAADAAAFVRGEQVPKLVEERKLKPFRRWQAYSRELRRDPSLLAYYDFQPKPGDPSVLPNVAANGDHSLDGTIENARWTVGRMIGKHALMFNGLDDRVRVNMPQKTSSISLAAWVHFDSFEGQPLSGLLMSTGWMSPGQIHWQINRVGQAVFSCPTGLPGRCSSPPVVDDRQCHRWMHLVCVCDRTDARLRFYADGRSVSETEYRLSAPFVIGPASIGNWDRDGSPETDLRNLRGRIDELAIFGRTLVPDEVRRIYEAGNSRQLSPTQDDAKGGPNHQVRQYP